MNKIQRQTKQAFLFSLVFYGIGVAVFLFPVDIPFAAAVVSLAVLLSMIWVILVLRELFISSQLTTSERIVWALAIVLFNVLAGIPYFTVARSRVTGISKKAL